MSLRTFLFVMTLLILSSNSKADFKDWEIKDKTLFATYTTLTIADVLQTRSAMKDPCNCFQEINPIYGSTATDTELLLINGASIGLFYYILDKHPEDRFIRKVIKVASVLRVAAITNNHYNGVSFEYAF